MKQFIVMLLFSIPVWAHTQGIGDSPFRSVWTRRTFDLSRLYKPIYMTSKDTAITAAMVYWFFNLPPAPPSTVLKDRIGRGIIPFAR